MMLLTTVTLCLVMLTMQLAALPNMIPQNALAFHGYGNGNMKVVSSNGYPGNIKKSDMLLRFGKRDDRKLLLRFGRVPVAYYDLPHWRDDDGYNYGHLEEP
ncbi:unnamed protein product [Soboliphyme baturini]|uniref:Uncharacterized protein n=1 Tax=Soboliphyme baturini TaxID=241478 RepID=A0A183J4P9_9BILA|nr:unnamed protein product [Soboliphyme baturini]